MRCVDRVLVVGGGISGMSLAICLQQTGIAADIVEINSTWGTYRAGISLTGPSLRALKRLGVLDRVEREGFCSDGAKFCDRSGKIIFATPTVRSLGDDIPNSGGIMRPVLHAILVEATRSRGVDVRLGLTVEQLQRGARGVGVTFSDGSQAIYDLVVGADGVSSHVRTIIFPRPPDQNSQVKAAGARWRRDHPRLIVTHLFLGGPVKAGFNPSLANRNVHVRTAACARRSACTGDRSA